MQVRDRPLRSGSLSDKRRGRRYGWICAVLGAAALLPAEALEPAASAPMLGFNASDAQQQRALEQRFDAALNTADLHDWLQQMSSEPNQVGSAHDEANARFMLQQFRDWGWDANIESFSVLYPTPKHVALQMIAPTRYSAKLYEPPVAGDASSARAVKGLPPYNVYGADGDVTGELVYVNFGMPQDYLELERRGITVAGKIVIVRYGEGWRGLKPKLAAEHGAIGCLIYSDPSGDGYGKGDVYPRGGWRPADGVQRGSVGDITLYPGDPLTPGVGSTADAQRLAMSAAKTLMKIPVLPISYADAQPLLAALSGPVAPPSWHGALPITYHMGAGPARVHLQIESNWGQKTIYDVIAKLKGSEFPDQWIVRGNHHDGWVLGAGDPLSGNVDMMAEAKSIGALLKTGWRPRRTLIYNSWDAEEPGLIGSTEWAETHAQELQAHAVLYVNSDENERGFLEAGGSHSMQRLVTEVSAEVRDPQTQGSVLARARAKLRVDAFQSGAGDGDHAQLEAQARDAANGADLSLEALGTGSDFTGFLQHLGITTLDLGYGGEADQYGVYHSAYDSFEHFMRFGDPGLAYGIAEAQTVGHVVLRVADADILPMQFGDLAAVYAGYVKELHALADDQREHAVGLGELLDAHAFELAADPTRAVAAPSPQGEVPFLDFAPLDNAIVRLGRSARAYDDAYASASRRGLNISAAQRNELNGILQHLEQTLLSESGLPGRPWYRHLIYAPGMLTGYGVKTMPGVREAIEGQRWQEAVAYVAITAHALTAYSEQLEASAALLRN
jgi:N-acetylated-alpha-linked acidic dipeptidase